MTSSYFARGFSFNKKIIFSDLIRCIREHKLIVFDKDVFGLLTL